MVQTFQGYFQEGRFVSPQAASIPECVEVYVVVTNKAVSAEQAESQKKRQTFVEFTQDAKTRKSDLILPPTLDTRGWRFDRGEANAR